MTGPRYWKNLPVDVAAVEAAKTDILNTRTLLGVTGTMPIEKYVASATGRVVRTSAAIDSDYDAVAANYPRLEAVTSIPDVGWTQHSSGWFPLAIDYTRGLLLGMEYTTSAGAKLYKSADGDNITEVLNSSTTDHRTIAAYYAAGGRISNIVVTDAGTWVMAMSRTDAYDGTKVLQTIYRSFDAGVTWEKIASTVEGTSQPISLLAYSNTVLYVEYLAAWSATHGRACHLLSHVDTQTPGVVVDDVILASPEVADVNHGNHAHSAMFWDDTTVYHHIENYGTVRLLKPAGWVAGDGAWTADAVLFGYLTAVSVSGMQVSVMRRYGEKLYLGLSSGGPLGSWCWYEPSTGRYGEGMTLADTQRPASGTRPLVRYSLDYEVCYAPYIDPSTGVIYASLFTFSVNTATKASIGVAISCDSGVTWQMALRLEGAKDLGPLYILGEMNGRLWMQATLGTASSASYCCSIAPIAATTAAAVRLGDAVQNRIRWDFDYHAVEGAADAEAVAFTWPVTSAADITVFYKNVTTGSLTLRAITEYYTVALSDGGASGGTVTWVGAIDATHSIFVTSGWRTGVGLDAVDAGGVLSPDGSAAHAFLATANSTIIYSPALADLTPADTNIIAFKCWAWMKPHVTNIRWGWWLMLYDGVGTAMGFTTAGEAAKLTTEPQEVIFLAAVVGTPANQQLKMTLYNHTGVAVDADCVLYLSRPELIAMPATARYPSIMGRADQNATRAAEDLLIPLHLPTEYSVGFDWRPEVSIGEWFGVFPVFSLVGSAPASYVKLTWDNTNKYFTLTNGNTSVNTAVMRFRPYDRVRFFLTSNGTNSVLYVHDPVNGLQTIAANGIAVPIPGVLQLNTNNDRSLKGYGLYGNLLVSPSIMTAGEVAIAAVAAPSDVLALTDGRVQAEA